MTPRTRAITTTLSERGEASTSDLIACLACCERDARLTLGIMARVGQIVREPGGGLASLDPRSPGGAHLMRREPRAKEIQEAVARYFELSRVQLLAEDRRREIARPRQIAIFLTRELTNYSLHRIATLFGGRDHTTILHAIRTIAGLIETHPGTGYSIRAIRAQIASGAFASDEAA